ncbi:hypothetical protein [Bradyrhizobium hereditatis]|nr:hypothetical protein [Bradyrhizobium hereditatis]
MLFVPYGIVPLAGANRSGDHQRESRAGSDEWPGLDGLFDP